MERRSSEIVQNISPDVNGYVNCFYAKLGLLLLKSPANLTMEGLMAKVFFE